MDNKTQNPVDAQLNIVKMLLFAMLSSVGVFFFLSWQTPQNPNFTPAEEPQTQLFMMLAGMLAVMSFVIPMILTPKGQRDPEGKKISNPAVYFVPAVLSFAMSEAIAIFGFLSTNQTGDFQTFIPFGIAAGALILLHGVSALNKLKAMKMNVI